MPDTSLVQRAPEGVIAAPVPTFEELIGQAIQKGAPVETMEKLLAMREKLRQEDARTRYYEALSQFQEAVPSVPKTKTATVTSRNNPGASYSYNYAPLEKIIETIRGPLRTYGLSYRFDTTFEEAVIQNGVVVREGAQVVTCTVTHVAGHEETSTFRSPIDASARMNVMQQSASAQTYAKRYALCNALGIVTADDDDDGQGAGNWQQPPAQAQRPQRPQTAPRGETPTPARSRPPAAPRPAQRAAPAGDRIPLEELRSMACPQCGVVGSIGQKSNGHLFCAKGRGGCGEEWRPGEEPEVLDPPDEYMADLPPIEAYSE